MSNLTMSQCVIALLLAAGFGLYVGEFLAQEWREFRAEQRRRKYAGEPGAISGR